MQKIKKTIREKSRLFGLFFPGGSKLIFNKIFNSNKKEDSHEKKRCNTETIEKIKICENKAPSLPSQFSARISELNKYSPKGSSTFD